MISGSFRTAREDRSCRSTSFRRSAPFTSITRPWKLAGTTRATANLRDYAPSIWISASPKPDLGDGVCLYPGLRVPTAQPCCAGGTEPRRFTRAIPNPAWANKYANYYGAGVGLFLTPDNWSNYSCAQTEISSFPLRPVQGRRRSVPDLDSQSGCIMHAAFAGRAGWDK